MVALRSFARESSDLPLRCAGGSEMWPADRDIAVHFVSDRDAALVGPIPDAVDRPLQH